MTLVPPLFEKILRGRVWTVPETCTSYLKYIAFTILELLAFNPVCAAIVCLCADSVCLCAAVVCLCAAIVCLCADSVCLSADTVNCHISVLSQSSCYCHYIGQPAPSGDTGKLSPFECSSVLNLTLLMLLRRCLYCHSVSLAVMRFSFFCCLVSLHVFTGLCRNDVV